MVRRPSVPQGRKRRLEDGEEERLLAACDRGRTPLLKQLVILAIETGMRRGELLGLRWEHVHLTKRIVHLPLTKNGESRDVPLSRRATDTLTALSEHKRPNIDLVFPMTGNSVRLAFEHLRMRSKEKAQQRCRASPVGILENYFWFCWPGLLFWSPCWPPC
jgi:integrase